MTVGQAVRFTRAFYERYRWNQPLLEQILDHFELSPKRKIRRLSHGQQAQVALALAVASDPELLILDDPTLGLDTVVRRDFLESLIQIIQRRGRTILFSSHILGDVERVADRIGILVDGVLRVDCPTDHFKESVRKVLVEFPAGGEPPDIADCPGLVSRRKVGRKLELVVVGTTTNIESCSSRWICAESRWSISTWKTRSSNTPAARAAVCRFCDGRGGGPCLGPRHERVREIRGIVLLALAAYGLLTVAAVAPASPLNLFASSAYSAQAGGRAVCR